LWRTGLAAKSETGETGETTFLKFREHIFEKLKFENSKKYFLKNPKSTSRLSRPSRLSLESRLPYRKGETRCETWARHTPIPFFLIKNK